MATRLDPLSLIEVFGCPCRAGVPLAAGADAATCSACGRVYPVRDGILEFVDPRELSDEKSRELRGQTFELTSENVQRYATKDTWSSYRAHFDAKKFRLLANYLGDCRSDVLVSLGSGFGFELKGILPLRPFRRVFSSDLSFTKVCVVPHTLADRDVDICLFTSDLDACPIRTDEFPVLVYEALHHTPDIHQSLELLLDRGYERILLVEPVTNWLMRILERRGLARRQEGSGVIPGRLRLETVEGLALSYGYSCELTTTWTFPEDYFGRQFSSGGLLQRPFLLLADVISAVTRPLRFGNFAVFQLRRGPDWGEAARERGEVHRG